MTSPYDYPIPVRLNVAVINYRDLENLIKEEYGREINIAATYEMGNESFINIDLDDVDEDGIIMSLHDTQMNDWLESSDIYIDLELVMCDLVLKGILPAKEYLVEVWW